MVYPSGHMRREPPAANNEATIIDIGIMAFDRAPEVVVEEPPFPPEPLGTDESPLVLFA
jgi:hypothetical protein